MRRHQPRSLWLLSLVALMILIPWTAGLWYLVQLGWAWYWWAGALLLVVLAVLLARPRPPLMTLPQSTPGGSAAEQRARAALRRRAAGIVADDLCDLDAVPRLVIAAFQDVAAAYAPRHPAALWRFTPLELLWMIEDLTQRVRGTLLVDFPMLRHIELSWLITLLGTADPLGRLMRLYPVLRWVNPRSAFVSAVQLRLTAQAPQGDGDPAKVKLGVLLIEQAGETAIQLYSGGYRRRPGEEPRTARPSVGD